MVEQIALSTNKIHKEDSLAVLNYSTKGVMTDSFRREYFPQPFIEHLITLLIRKLVKSKSFLVRKLSKAPLKFIIVIVQSKTEIVQSMHIVQIAARTIGETVSKQARFVGC